MKDPKVHPVTLSTIAFLKVSAATLFSLLMSQHLCPSWFLALLLSANILQCMGLMVLKVPSRGVMTCFAPLRLGQWNTVLQFSWIGLCLADSARNDFSIGALTLNFGYLVLASLQILVFFKYLFRFRLLVLRVFEPNALPRLPETATQSG